MIWSRSPEKAAEVSTLQSVYDRCLPHSAIAEKLHFDAGNGLRRWYKLIYVFFLGLVLNQ